MTELRPPQKLKPAKKITEQALRDDPLLAAIARSRAKAVRAMLNEKKKWEFDLD